MNNYFLKNREKQKGAVAILLTLLILSVTLLIGAGLSSIFLSELKSSTAVRQSGPAFYAADAGAEHALWHRFKRSELSGSFSFALSNGANSTATLLNDSIRSSGVYLNTRRTISVSW